MTDSQLWSIIVSGCIGFLYIAIGLYNRLSQGKWSMQTLFFNDEGVPVESVEYRCPDVDTFEMIVFGLGEQPDEEFDDNL